MEGPAQGDTPPGGSREVRGEGLLGFPCRPQGRRGAAADLPAGKGRGERSKGPGDIPGAARQSGLFVFVCF